MSATTDAYRFVQSIVDKTRGYERSDLVAEFAGFVDEWCDIPPEKVAAFYALARAYAATDKL